MQRERDHKYPTSNPLQNSDALLRAMIENLPGGAAFVVDRELRYVLTEGEALATAGFKPEDFVGRTIFEVLPPELVASYEPMYRQALAGEPFEHEHNSHSRTYISRGTPLRTDNGAISAVLVVSYDITDRKRIEAKHKQAEAAIAADLRDTQLLHNLATRLTPESDIQTLYQEIMSAAIALTRADAGTVQILDEATQDLLLLATQGFERKMTNHFYRVNARSNTPCGIALATGDRTFVNFDVPESEDPDGSCRMHIEAGLLSAQSTPLITRSGQAIGMVSTHWRGRYHPSDRELRFLDLLARQAADLIEQRQAQIGLRESEAKYRSLFESIDEGFCILEMIDDEKGQVVDYRFVEVNPVFERQTGLKNVVGKLASEVVPNIERYWLETYDTVLKTGNPQRIENYNQATDRWYSAYASPVGGVGSRQVCTIFNDITERKRRELNTAFLDEIGKELSVLSTPDEIIQTVGVRLSELLQVSSCIFADVDEAKNEVTIHHGWNTPDVVSLKQTFRSTDYFGEEFARAGRAGETIIVRDTAQDERLNAEAYAQLKIGSLVTVSFQRNGRWTASIAVTTREPRDWREDEIGLLQEVINRVFPRIERARAEEALRESEAKYRSLFTSMDEGYFLCDVIFDENNQPIDLFYIDENPAAIRMTGQSFRGQRLREINPNYEDYWYEIFGRVAQTGQGERLERYAEPDQIWYDFYVFKVGGDDTRRVAVVFNDITDRKRAEEQLRHAAEMDAFRLTLSDALRPSSDPIALQETAMQVLGTHLGVNRAFYGEVLDDDDTLAFGPGYVNGLSPIMGQIKFSEFDSDLLTDYRAGRTVVINDLYEDVHLSAKAKTEFDAIQVRAAVGVALVKNEKVQAVLSIHQSVPRQWTPSEIALLEETADRTWAAVERTRTEVALRESELQRVREQAAREEERQRAESLAELDRAKTLFFSNISHEFRTPLTLSLAPLQDALKILERDGGDGEVRGDRGDEGIGGDQTPSSSSPPSPPSSSSPPSSLSLPLLRENLQLAHRNNLRLLKLVNTLLDFSRIEAGRMEAVYEPTDLATFTAELASVFRSAIERAGLQLIVDCPPLPQPVFVDREMWEKIVLNLLSNAFKFTFTGEIRVSLHSTDGNQAILQIQDTGTGIAPEHLPHLFERFYQVRGAQARTHEGSGIGLALVHELVQLQGGTIEVSSTAGEGTCFTITLPFGTDHLPRDRLQDEGDRIQPTRTLASTAMGAASYVEEAERWLPNGGNRAQPIGDSEEQPVQTADASLSKLSSARVLLVDDNADMREYLTRILSEHVQVEAVADGATALTVAQERVPDLILSDVMMPGLDGFELLQALRANPQTREVPIILLSARAGEEAIVEGLEAGADDYLIKPFSAQELVSRVLAHLQTSQSRGEALQQARSTLRSRDEFISVVSHELNTPLVSILGWTRMLRSSPSNPVMLNKALDTIERNATLQGKLVQDLLDLSRITAGKLRLNPQPIELKPVIETAIATVTQTAADKGVNLTWQENATEPVFVMGDSDRLQQVICNLLTNAIKFTPESGSVTLELSIINDDHASDTFYAEIRVIDSGIGIAADFLPYVFDRFRQAEGAHSAKGLGLGLAIARHIVELHDGTICAESAGEGQGATFIVCLPLLKSSESTSVQQQL